MIATLIVGLAGLYLVSLAMAAVVAPERLRRFLNAHASSARAHFLEMGARLVAGIALVSAAPRMRFPQAFGAFGWLLIGTTVVLCLVPWRFHQRFAQRVLPIATERLAILAIGALAGGVILLVSLVPGRAP